jgi:hypothetical protein
MNCEISFHHTILSQFPVRQTGASPLQHHVTDSRCTSRLIAATFYLALSLPVVAQQPQAPPVDRRNADRQRQQDTSRREYQLRNFGIERNGAIDDKQKKALMAQLEQDFNRIMLLHNQIARAISSESVLDYRFVSDTAGEIKKRSTRLQSTLALGPPDADNPDSKALIELGQNELKPALFALCKHIRNFVTNPVIETPGTVDAVHLAKARRDLASIVTLSGLIRKQADQTHPTAPKNY